MATASEAAVNGTKAASAGFTPTTMGLPANGVIRSTAGCGGVLAIRQRSSRWGSDWPIPGASGERRETRSAEVGSTLLREMRYGSFSREFRLPDTVAADQVSADYADGILRLHIAGVKPAPAEPHKIQVDERPAGVSVTATDQAEVESAE